MYADAKRGRTLIEEGRGVVFEERDFALLASRRARQSIDALREGRRLPEGLLSGDRGVIPLTIPFEVEGRRERLVYLSQGGDLAADEGLPTGFTAAVSPA